jgi:hypothetical protein
MKVTFDASVTIDTQTGEIELIEPQLSKDYYAQRDAVAWVDKALTYLRELKEKARDH